MNSDYAKRLWFPLQAGFPGQRGWFKFVKNVTLPYKSIKKQLINWLTQIANGNLIIAILQNILLFI
jgi:hypothetical protein